MLRVDSVSLRFRVVGLGGSVISVLPATVL